MAEITIKNFALSAAVFVISAAGARGEEAANTQTDKPTTANYASDADDVSKNERTVAQAGTRVGRPRSSPIVRRPIPSVVLRRPEPEAYAPDRSGRRSTVDYKLAGKRRTVKLNYEIIDGYGVYEGDIILGRQNRLSQTQTERRECSGDICSVQSPLISIAGENYLWPGGVIPYEIDSAYPADERQAILDGIALVDGVTNLIVKPREGESDYVRFKRTNEGCSSAVGRQGGRQNINIKKWNETWCPAGSIAHEILHAAGVWHEQSRKDRDRFVKILRDNIESGKRRNFDQHISDGVDIGAYDYGSIMHYRANAFGKPDPVTGEAMTTIAVMTQGAVIGNRTALSAMDVSGVNSLYKNEDCVYFNPDRLFLTKIRSRRWRLDERLADGRTHQIVIAGHNQSEANRTLELARHYRFDQACFVGRPDPSMSYFLSGGSAPSGAYAGEDCIAINPAGSRVVKDGGWKIVEDRSDGRHSIAEFPNPGEAYRTLDIWRQRNFRHICYVGRPRPAVTYYRR